MPRVSDIMNAKLLYIRDGNRLSLARAKILEFGVSAVPILDEQHRPVGVVSLRDLASSDGEPKGSRPACVVRGDATLTDGARTLADSGLDHLVVVDEAGIAIGMISAVDFIHAPNGAPVRHPQPFSRF
jgi:CBS domain-containing protein